MTQAKFQWPGSEPLPTMYDLPSEDPEEPGLPDEFHDLQPKLLRETCVSPLYGRDQMFIGADLNLYYDSHHPQWYKRPDWFLCLGVSPAQQQQQLRWSYGGMTLRALGWQRKPRPDARPRPKPSQKQKPDGQQSPA